MSVSMEESMASNGGYDGEYLEIGLSENAKFLKQVPMKPLANDKEADADVQAGWSKIDKHPSNTQFQRCETLFPNLNEDASPMDCFEVFFGDDMWELLAQETNRFVANKTSKRDVTVKELKIFMAMVIRMQFTRIFAFEGMFAETNFDGEIQLFQKMTQARFEMIMSSFHLADYKGTPVKEGQDGYDPLFEVRPFIELLQKNFRKYSPDRNLLFMEESKHASPFNGSRKRSYCSNEPDVILYKACECNSGYCIGFNVVMGDEEEDDDEQDNDEPIESGNPAKKVDTVLNIVRDTGLANKGHHIYMDDRYATPELFEKLDRLQTYACANLRFRIEGMPKAFYKVNLNIGEGIFRRKGNMLAVKYKENGDIFMLSTVHMATMTVTNKKSRKTGVAKKIPTVMAEYSQNLIKGIDFVEQMDSLIHDDLQKTMNWWRKLFLQLLHIMLTNAYVLYRKHAQKLENNGNKFIFLKGLITSLST